MRFTMPEDLPPYEQLSEIKVTEEEFIKTLIENGHSEDNAKFQVKICKGLGSCMRVGDKLFTLCNSMSTVETLYDDESTREKHKYLSKFEVMADDDRNDDYDSFWLKLDDYIKWGKTYKITIEEVE